jgi:hypothetical protein
MMGPGSLRAKLFAMATPKERKAWQAFSDRYEGPSLLIYSGRPMDHAQPAAVRGLEYLEQCRLEAEGRK